jgi:hypothetical protein
MACRYHHGTLQDTDTAQRHGTRLTSDAEVGLVRSGIDEELARLLEHGAELQYMGGKSLERSKGVNE